MLASWLWNIWELQGASVANVRKSSLFSQFQPELNVMIGVFFHFFVKHLGILYVAMNSPYTYRLSNASWLSIQKQDGVPNDIYPLTSLMSKTLPSAQLLNGCFLIFTQFFVLELCTFWAHQFRKYSNQPVWQQPFKMTHITYLPHSDVNINWSLTENWLKLLTNMTLTTILQCCSMIGWLDNCRNP